MDKAAVRPKWNPQNISEVVAKERRIIFRTPKILGTDVVQICTVRQLVLRDDINIAPVEILLSLRLAGMWDETLAENHVSRTKTAGIGAAKQDGVAGHLRIN